MKKFPHYKQLDAMDCGPTCLRMIAKHYGKHYSLGTLRQKCFIGREGVSMPQHNAFEFSHFHIFSFVHLQIFQIIPIFATVFKCSTTMNNFGFYRFTPPQITDNQYFAHLLQSL